MNNYLMVPITSALNRLRGHSFPETSCLNSILNSATSKYMCAAFSGLATYEVCKDPSPATVLGAGEAIGASLGHGEYFGMFRKRVQMLAELPLVDYIAYLVIPAKAVPIGTVVDLTPTVYPASQVSRSSFTSQDIGFTISTKRFNPSPQETTSGRLCR